LVGVGVVAVADLRSCALPAAPYNAALTSVRWLAPTYRDVGSSMGLDEESFL